MQPKWRTILSLVIFQLKAPSPLSGLGIGNTSPIGKCLFFSPPWKYATAHLNGQKGNTRNKKLSTLHNLVNYMQCSIQRWKRYHSFHKPIRSSVFCLCVSKGYIISTKQQAYDILSKITGERQRDKSKRMAWFPARLWGGFGANNFRGEGRR